MNKQDLEKYNKNNNSFNYFTTINLGKCENLLKEHYQIEMENESQNSLVFLLLTN